MHKLKLFQGRKGSMVLKTNLEKDYDRIMWDFLKDTLISFNFPICYTNLILTSLSSSKFSVLWNGVPDVDFLPERGLRQGCPMSPYLFLLCLERLSSTIQRTVDQNIWKPIQICRDGLQVASLFFAYDLLLCAEAFVEQITITMGILQNFVLHLGNPSI